MFLWQGTYTTNFVPFTFWHRCLQTFISYLLDIFEIELANNIIARVVVWKYEEQRYSYYCCMKVCALFSVDTCSCKLQASLNSPAPKIVGSSCYKLWWCVVLCILIVLFYVLFCVHCVVHVLFVCKCVLYYCHRVSTQLQLNISNHIISYIISYHIIYHIISAYGCHFFFIRQWWVASSCRLVCWVNTAHSASCPHALQ